MRRNTWRASGILWLALTGCDACGHAAPPSGAVPAEPIAPMLGSGPSAAIASANANVAAARSVAGAAAAAAALPELQVPANQIYDVGDLKPGEKRPLSIFLHGLGASGKIAFDVLHLAALGARERVFVVAPDGTVDRLRHFALPTSEKGIAVDRGQSLSGLKSPTQSEA